MSAEIIIRYDSLSQIKVVLKKVFLLHDRRVTIALQLIDEVICTLLFLTRHLWPLVAILGELDAVIVPCAVEVLWATFRRDRKVDHYAAVRIDPSWQMERSWLFTITSDAFTVNQDFVAVGLILESDHTEAANMIGVSVASKVWAPVVPRSAIVPRLDITGAYIASLCFVESLPQLV